MLNKLDVLKKEIETQTTAEIFEITEKSITLDLTSYAENEDIIYEELVLYLNFKEDVVYLSGEWDLTFEIDEEDEDADTPPCDLYDERFQFFLFDLLNINDISNIKGKLMLLTNSLIIKNCEVLLKDE